MSKEVSTVELQLKLNEFLDRVHHEGDRLIVKDDDKPLAAIVPIDIYERVFSQQKASFAILEKIWDKIPKVDEEEAQNDIEKAIIEARERMNVMN